MCDKCVSLSVCGHMCILFRLFFQSHLFGSYSWIANLSKTDLIKRNQISDLDIQNDIWLACSLLFLRLFHPKMNAQRKLEGRGEIYIYIYININIYYILVVCITNKVGSHIKGRTKRLVINKHSQQSFTTVLRTYLFWLIMYNMQYVGVQSCFLMTWIISKYKSTSSYNQLLKFFNFKIFSSLSF